MLYFEIQQQWNKSSGRSNDDAASSPLDRITWNKQVGEKPSEAEMGNNAYKWHLKMEAQRMVLKEKGRGSFYTGRLHGDWQLSPRYIQTTEERLENGTVPLLASPGLNNKPFCIDQKPQSFEVDNKVTFRYRAWSQQFVCNAPCADVQRSEAITDIFWSRINIPFRSQSITGLYRSLFVIRGTPLSRHHGTGVCSSSLQLQCIIRKRVQTPVAGSVRVSSKL